MSTEQNSVFLVVDHIDPDDKLPNYGDLGVEHDNEKTTACIACNCFFKNRYPPQGNTRKDKIENAKKHIKQKRKKYFEWFRKVKAGLV